MGERELLEAAVFVQLADGGRSPRAMCTRVRYTNGELVLRLGDEDVVIVRNGRYALPLVQARAGTHWELTLTGPAGERILLQFGRAGKATAPPPEEGDGAVTALDRSLN